MATLLLTVAGSLLGGPVGAAIGAFAGQQLDNRLFAPKARQGPRLNELSVQASSYGSPIPKLFGRVRVSGSVIWATDLQETRRKVSTGKGRPKQTVYSYAANFAVALSGRPVGRIGRIWADGKLLRGEAGDFKSETQFRFYSGSEGQAVDPLIASVEGAGGATAFRGIAYAVFEDFQLADYGNRIPSLSFEVIADETPVSFGSVIASLASSGLATQCPSLVDGFVTTGDSMRGVAETISSVAPLYLSDNGRELLLSEGFDGLSAIPELDLGASASDQTAPRLEQERASLAALPERRILAYADVARDYQQGTQSARRPGGGARAQNLELAASLSSTRARQLIEARLAADLGEAETCRISLPWRHLTLLPGGRLQLPGQVGEFGLTSVRLERMALTLELKRVVDALSSNGAAEPGRVISELDALHGPTRLHLLDLPWLDAGLATRPAVYAAAAGDLPGWRRAALLQSVDGGLSFEEIGATAASAIIGMTTSALASGSYSGLDLRSTVEIELLHDDMLLNPATHEGLLNGANLMMLGDEVIQFAIATQIGPKRYKLSHLLRGRRGTEWAMASHAVGERAILIENATLLPLAIPMDAASVHIQAQGLGDSNAVLASLLITGEALRPPSPVHVRYQPLANGDTAIYWIRRSRDGWRWSNGGDAPLGEETERYRMTVTPDASPPRTVELLQPQWVYTAAERSTDIAAGSTSMSLELVQLGTFGASRPARLTFSMI